MVYTKFAKAQYSKLHPNHIVVVAFKECLDQVINNGTVSQSVSLTRIKLESEQRKVSDLNKVHNECGQ